jgi:hypothetical protein
VKYEIGDKIIVLHSDEEGKVVDIINDKMVMIEVRGVKFPAYMDQIDFPYFKMFTSKKIVEKKKIHIDDVRKEKQASRKKVADGVFISMVPVYDKDIFGDEYVQKLKIYLINHNEEDYRFAYNLRFLHESHFELSSELRGLNDFYLHDIEVADISDNPFFDFEFSLVKPNAKKNDFLEKQLKLRGKQLFKKMEEIHEKNEPSFSYELFIHYPDKIVEPKLDLSKLGNAGYKIYDASKIKSNIPQPRSVVDLHIDKLVDFWEQMSSAEIIELQMSTFEKHLDLAKLHQMQSIIFIHGIGEGILKNELHERLRHKKYVKSFVNQYHHLYGYGATEVYLD